MELRNIAIIAHVDHGKTTLVDELMKQSGQFRENQHVEERVMDSGDIEKERGITILAKCTSVEWKDVRINIVDTPGHADFGGEVERILSMVDGVVLLVDAAEGPMPQTKFVTGKALKLGLKPIVVVNKADRPDARPYEVQDECFDLFTALDANDEQLDFPTLFASGKNGWAAETPDGDRTDLTPLYDLILEHVKEPVCELEKPFSMLATTLESDPFLGRILTGRVQTGTFKVNQNLKAMTADGEVIEQARITKLLSFRGVDRVPVEEAHAGDIVAVAGLTKANVADTLCAPELEVPLKAQPIDPPTLAMTFSVNNSPLAGQEGSKVTSRMIRDRLLAEAEGNVAITVSETENADSFEVAGRGELQLGVIIETMRREGFELGISRPRVLIQEDPETGEKLEPFEEVQIDVDEEFSGIVVESLAIRKGKMTEMRPSGGGKTRLTFHAPARGLIGYHGEFLTETRGTGIMARTFHHFGAYAGAIPGRRNGVLISMVDGAAVGYALANLEGRGPLFVSPQTKIYQGMIIGEHAKGTDLEVNAMKAKQLTNHRASGKDDAIRLTPPRPITLEDAIAYIQDDELVEVTPESIRLRKFHLDPHVRKRAERAVSEL
ncbi:GTP-binding protein [Candidatus Terasakiella magnetica]|uniref:Large ribosomal subunit assembly factor BipA n=1 Tax=Candidatus Terasakiella magnetica TaxID=1867952 RepID=A0A1C3RGE1_9PROT|nr:translational GTPase TypA [Candidatus Terasakiella magnetica]SCA56321.1 GTP-binding protein [Candidatus Terasakiella magnetica]